MIATNVRRLGLYLMLAFARRVGAASSGGRWSRRRQLATRPDNPEVIAARRSLPRGTIFDSDGPAARLLRGDRRAEPSNVCRPRVHPRHRLREPAIRQRPGSSAHSRTSWLARPIRTRSATSSSEILARQPAAARPDADDRPAAPGLRRGAARRRPSVRSWRSIRRPGAILAMVSMPTYDATPISGDPEAAQEPMDALRNDPAEPLAAPRPAGPLRPGLDHEGVHRRGGARCGRDHAARPPSPISRSRRREGFVVNGFTIREHDLGGIAAGALAPVRGAAGVEQHLLRPRRTGARRGAVPRLRAPLRLLLAARHRPSACAAGGPSAS